MPNPRSDLRPVGQRSLRDIVDPRMALFFECNNCTRLRRVDPLDLIAAVQDADAQIETLLFRSLCSLCGKKRVTPLLCDEMMRKDMGWFPRPPRAGR